MKRLNKILSVVQKFASKDYTARYINGIKFDKWAVASSPPLGGG